MERDGEYQSDISEVAVILTERGSKYGSFTRLSVYEQLLKDAIRNHPQWEQLRPFEKTAIEMILHKVARLVNGGGGSNHLDTVIDIQGYAKLIQDEYERRA